MPPSIRAGRALTQVGADGKHLWFVLTDPDPETKKVVTVMLVTARSYTDKTVVLQPGVHPFVVVDSNVNYSSANLVPLSRLNSRVASGKAVLYSDMSPDLLRKVRKGLLASTRTPNYVKDYCKGIF